MPEPEQPKRNIDERIDALTMNLDLLGRDVEMLRGSVSDLSATVHAMVADTKERRLRDRQYFHALAQLLESWSNGTNHE